MRHLRLTAPMSADHTPRMMRRGAARALSGVARALDEGRQALTHGARVARFLEGRLAFTPRPDDVYVATYPRSGTTWMQFLLYLMTSDRRVDFGHISEVSPWFERTLAHGTRRVQDFERMAGPRLFKTHLPPQWVPRPGRAIYIERDGRDVAVSYYHLYRTHLGFTGDFSAFFERFMRGDVQYRSWFKHVAAWRAHADDPRVLYLRYEDLLGDLEGTARRVAGFLGLGVPEAAWPDIVHKASRPFMKAHEARFDPITETLIDLGIRTGHFIREGRKGAGRERLAADEEARFLRAAKTPVRAAEFELDLPAFLH